MVVIRPDFDNEYATKNIHEKYGVRGDDSEIEKKISL